MSIRAEVVVGINMVVLVVSKILFMKGVHINDIDRYFNTHRKPVFCRTLLCENICVLGYYHRL
jgi:hypothetical protein